MAIYEKTGRKRSGLFVISSLPETARGQDTNRVKRMTGLNRLIGLTVVVGEKQDGRVLRGVLSTDGRHLRGLVVRGGLRGARWVPREDISLLGDVSVIAKSRPKRCPKDSGYRLFRVSDTLGARLGIVTDALIDEKTLKVVALQVSSGPIDDLIDGRWYATNFSVTRAGRATGHVTIGEGRLTN